MHFGCPIPAAGRRLSSGHSFYRVQAEIEGGTHVETGRMVLVR